MLEIKRKLEHNLKKSKLQSHLRISITMKVWEKIAKFNLHKIQGGRYITIYINNSFLTIKHILKRKMNEFHRGLI